MSELRVDKMDILSPYNCLPTKIIIESQKKEHGTKSVQKSSKYVAAHSLKGTLEFEICMLFLPEFEFSFFGKLERVVESLLSSELASFPESTEEFFFIFPPFDEDSSLFSFSFFFLTSSRSLSSKIEYMFDI